MKNFIKLPNFPGYLFVGNAGDDDMAHKNSYCKAKHKYKSNAEYRADAQGNKTKKPEVK